MPREHGALPDAEIRGRCVAAAGAVMNVISIAEVRAARKIAWQKRNAVSLTRSVLMCLEFYGVEDDEALKITARQLRVLAEHLEQIIEAR